MRYHKHHKSRKHSRKASRPMHCEKLFSFTTHERVVQGTVRQGHPAQFSGSVQSEGSWSCVISVTGNPPLMLRLRTLLWTVLAGTDRLTTFCLDLRSHPFIAWIGNLRAVNTSAVLSLASCPKFSILFSNEFSTWAPCFWKMKWWHW